MASCDLSEAATMWGRLWQSWRTLGPEKVALFAACNLPWLDFRFELAPKAGFDTGAEHVWTC